MNGGFESERFFFMDFRDIGAFLGFGSERFSVMKFQDIDVFGLRAGVRFLCEVSRY